MKNKLTKRLSFFTFFFCLAQSFCFAAEKRDTKFLIKLRSVGEASIYPHDFRQHEVILDQTKEFKNGNTYVMLHPQGVNKKYPLAYGSVAILAPTTLSPDDSMELFFKVFAAKMQMAKKVSVYFPEGSLPKKNLPYGLPLEQLLKTCLADELYIGSDLIDLKKIQTLESPEPNGQRFFISGNSHPELRDNLAQSLGKTFVSIASLGDQEITGETVYLVSPPAQPANESLLKTLSEIYFLSQEKRAFVHLVSSYLPYARSDKPEIPYGVGCQGSLVAKLLESVGMGAITVVRPHAPQSSGFFSVPNYVVSGRKTMTDYLKAAVSEIDVVVSPDAGFQKDATKYADALNLPVLVMNKQRSVTGEAKLIESTNLEGIRGKNLVIIDDEASGGSTLVKVATSLKAFGANDVYAMVTHLSGAAKALLAAKGVVIKEVIVTDTLPIPGDLMSSIKVLSMASEIAEHIQSLEGDVIKTRVAFDLGSAKLKLSVALLNERTQQIEIKEKEIYRLGLMRDMRENNSDSISPKKIAELLGTLKEIKERLGQNHSKIAYGLIATEGLRKAKNSQVIIKAIESLGIRASIISQDEEARLGFKTGEILAQNKTEIQTLVWDQGGGSFQISYQEEDGSIGSQKGQVGSVAAAEYMLQEIQGIKLGSQEFKPVSEGEAIRFVQEIGKIIPAPTKEFSQKLKGSVVIGIGGKTSVLGLAARMADKKNFSKEDLWMGVMKHLTFSAQELEKKFTNTSTNTLIPRALLVYTMMNKLKIEKVAWGESEGSTLGLLSDDSYWVSGTVS